MAGSYPALEVSFAPGVASSAVPGALDWVDITSYVLSADEKVGSEDEFSEPGAGSLDLELDNSRGRFDPDAAYDATDRPYAGDLLPLTWFRWRGGDSSVDTDVFYGQVSIEGFRLGASQFSGQMVVRVTVLDMLEQLANTDLPSSVYAIEVEADSPDTWWRLGESSGTVATDSSGNERHGTYEGGLTFNSRAGLIANDSDTAIEWEGVDVNRVTLSASPITAYPFSIEAWLVAGTRNGFQQNIYMQGGTDHTIQIGLRASDAGSNPGGLFLYSYGANGDIREVDATTDRLDDDQIHHVVVTMTNATTVAMYVDSAASALSTSTAGAPTFSLNPEQVSVGALVDRYAGISDAFTGTLDEVALYSSALSAPRVLAHYEAGTTPWTGELTSERATHLLDSIDFPASLRTIDTGQSTMPAASLATDALSALQETAKAEGGDLYADGHDGGKLRFRDRHAKWTDARSVTSQATFGDGAGEVTYSAVDIQDDRIINYAAVQRANGATMVAQDAASMTQYQRRTLSESGLLIESDAEAQHRANLIVAEKKDRHRRVRSVTLEPAKSTHPAWAQVFAREIGDRVTVKWRPPYGGTYTFDSWIIGISHSWRPADSSPWRTAFYLEPVPYGATGNPYFIVSTDLVSGPAKLGY